MEKVPQNNLITDAEKDQVEFIISTFADAEQVVSSDTHLSPKQLAEAVSLGQVSLLAAIENATT